MSQFHSPFKLCEVGCGSWFFLKNIDVAAIGVYRGQQLKSEIERHRHSAVIHSTAVVPWSRYLTPIISATLPGLLGSWSKWQSGNGHCMVFSHWLDHGGGIWRAAIRNKHSPKKNAELWDGPRNPWCMDPLVRPWSNGWSHLSVCPSNYAGGYLPSYIYIVTCCATTIRIP
jgi:hypothetical protein